MMAHNIYLKKLVNEVCEKTNNASEIAQPIKCESQ